MKSILLTATIALFAAHVSAQSPSKEQENRGTAVSAVATEKQHTHGQAVQAAALNSHPEKDKADQALKDKAKEAAQVEKVVKEDRVKDGKTADQPDNHGQEVKATAQRSDLSGKEKGQAVKAVASDKSEPGEADHERAEKPAKADKAVKADKPAHPHHRTARPPHGGAQSGPKAR